MVMKIAVDATMLAAGGGLNGLVNYLNEWGGEKDVEVSVYVSRAGVLARLETECPGVVIKPWGIGIPPVLRHIARSVWLSRLIDKSDADVILTTNSMTGRTRCPQVVHHRNLLWFLPELESNVLASNIPSFYRAGWRRAARKALRYADINVFISDHLAAVASTVVPALGNRVVVPNGLSRSALKSAAEIAEKFEIHSVKSDYDVNSIAPEAVILSVTSDNVHKNNQACVRTLKILVDREPDIGWRLEVAGRGEFSSVKNLAVELGVDSAVSWLGFLDEKSLAKCYSTACCMVFPSYVESFGNPPLEAMAHGCPVVASNIEAVSEVCGDAAVLHSPNDIESFALSVMKLRADEKYRKRLIGAGLERVMQYSWAQSAALLLRAMRSAVDQTPIR